MPDPIADAERRRAIAHTPLRQPSPLQRYRTAPGRHRVHGDVVLSSTCGEDPEGNTAFVLGPERVERILALADGFFGSGAYAVAVDQDAAPAVPQALVARGFYLEEQEPVLVLEPIPDEPASAPGLHIQRVDSAAGFEAFLRISQTARRWIPSLQAAQDPDVALLVGSLHGEPVATSRLTRYGEVAEILGVVTLPAYRRRGLGTALTWAAMAEARRRGCTALTLTASELGYGVYRRIGFVPTGRYLTYVGGR